MIPKKLFWAVLGIFVLGAMQAQTYTFESNYTNWSAQDGTLSLTTEHYKQGSKSLCWTTTGKSVLVVSGFTSFSTSTSNSAFMQIYSPEAENDTLVVEFMNGTSIKRTANYVCNYKGWREFNRPYREYASTAATKITALRITLKPANSDTRTICFDDVKLNTTTDAGRVPGCQWIIDRQYMTANTIPLTLYANETDLSLTTPTAQELADLATIRTRVARTLTYNASAALVARNWVNNNLTIIRNSDGSVCGTPINTTSSYLAVDSVITIVTRLQNIAAGKQKGVTGMETAFNNYLDHLLDQGFSEGCNIYFASNSYTAPKTIIPLLLNIIQECSYEQCVEVLKLARWLSYYGMVYYSEDTYLANLNSDVAYLFLPYMQYIAASYPDDAVAVRELRAVQRFLNRNTEYVPGGSDMLKPDGTGFHHQTHYNKYMYAYQTFSDVAYLFRDTEFQLSEEAYQRFGKAITSIYTMASPGTNDNRFYPLSLAGRRPFMSGAKLDFGMSRFKNLIAMGNSYPTIQEELKGAYNYFFQTNTYSVAENSFDGFHQFNYSPLGVYRHGNWVASMRAPTTKFWGAEIYSGTNRFGRYQSHGSLEIMYKGTSSTALAASGYPTATTNIGGGWDWNMPSGTTTVHYTSWQNMMPGSNTTVRFDQYTKTKDFAGAVGMGNYGVFACDFDQIDTWGSQCFTATNLVFKKSVFVFDSILVSLGSDIGASGSYGSTMITATNLFQNLVTSSNGALVVNGTSYTSTYSETLSTSQAHWMVTPTGTGYYIPTGNQAVTVSYGTQTTPNYTGSDYANPTTTATAAKAYINHGVKTSNNSYEFVVIPNVTSAQMQTLATQYASQKPYTVESKTSTVHAVSCGDVTAYTFFAAASGLTFGLVKSTTNQHLLIDKVDTNTGRHAFAVCNPNLNPTTDYTYGWVSTATTTVLTLDGEYKALAAVDGVSFATPSGGTTKVTVTMSDGEPVYFTAALLDDNLSTIATRAESNITFIRKTDKILIKSDISLGNITLLTVAGQVISRTVNNQNTAEISIAGLSQGIYVCHTDNGVYKFVK